MNNVVPQMTMPRRDVTLGRGINKGDQIASVDPAALDDLVHELRQPLSTIESLAYFLEITAVDDRVRGHLQRIQAMVSRAHGILDRSLDSPAFAQNLS
jgi:signal transduction histidine kinase